MKKIEGLNFDAERSLYNTKDSIILNCCFQGPADGESALKESRNIVVDLCSFLLRYPLWHVKKCRITNSNFFDTSRAPIWYCEDGEIENVSIKSVKALRESKNIILRKCNVESEEFGWKCTDIQIDNCKITGEYAFLDSKKIKIKDMDFKGKYSFQYIHNLEISNSNLDTKDAFWHSTDVTVKNSTIKGEYLGWFSDNLRLINCTIIGTQPLCYCKNLSLENCTMIDCDLAFEYSDVNAAIGGNAISIKNLKSGKIFAPPDVVVINDNPVFECTGEVITK